MLFMNEHPRLVRWACVYDRSAQRITSKDLIKDHGVFASRETSVCRFTPRFSIHRLKVDKSSDDI